MNLTQFLDPSHSRIPLRTPRGPAPRHLNALIWPRWACVLARSAILRWGYYSEHAFEHLGDAVIAGCGCEVVGGGNRVWMTA